MSCDVLLQLSLLHFVFLLLPIAFSSSFIAKPGCPDRCGNLSIPYPFGIGLECSMEEQFEITCDHSTNPPKAYTSLMSSDEVIEIKQSQLRIKFPYPVAGACYNNTVDVRSALALAVQFTFSDENWITAIGCDDLALVLVEGNQTDSRGCISYCASDSSGVGFCPNNINAMGKGCCRTPIPKGINFLDGQLSDLSEKWRRKRLFPCSYAFIQEIESEYKYPLSYLNNSTEFINDDGKMSREPPVVRLDWRIGNENCSQAQLNSTTYACQDHTVCVDYIGAASYTGYLCRCLKGYEGNPYLVRGCQDINECADSPCVSHSNCINTPGAFICSCPKGYQGDAMENGSGCSPTTIINVLIGVGSGLGFLLLLSICVWLRKALQKKKDKVRKEKFFKRNGGPLLVQGKTNVFPVEELEVATDHFNESRVVGQGGQGKVYRGMLSDGQIVAIKKLKLVDENQLEQFTNEVMILSQINHRNVVKLLGCCLETEVPMLVYEFLPNGTLFDLIHDPSTEFLVSWNMRLKIAIDIAGVLAYLHFESSVPIYHRDIKSSNFLLDEKYIIKVADFGISRSVALGQTHLTTMVKGTFGYFDPEYFQSRQYTEKSDVYSFGVVLVELLTGKRPIFRETSGEMEISLATYFLALMEQNSLDAILDPQVAEHGNKEDVVAVARLAQRCLNWRREMRPTMKEVATELESLIRISQMPATIKDESEDARANETNPMMISEIELARTTSVINEKSSSSDIDPLLLKTV